MADAGFVYVYVMIIFFVMLIVNYFIIKNKKNRTDEIKYIRNVTIWAGLCMLVNIAISLNDRLGVAYPLFSLYFAGIDILLLSFIRYMKVYCSMGEGFAIKIMTKGLFVFVILDVISLNLNTLTGHCFSLEMLETDAGQVYFTCIGKLPYEIHLYFDYGMILIMYAMLINKTTHVARIYRMRYVSYIIVLTIVVVVNIIYMFFNLKNDWSVALYGLFIVVTSNISGIYTVDRLKNVMLHEIIDDMDDGLLIFDENGDNIYANKLAMSILETDDMETVTDHDAVQKYLLAGDVSDDGITLRRDEKNGRYYKVFIEKITEKSGMEVGSFFIMRDITQAMRMIDAEREKNERDSLTGLYSRDYFYEVASDTIKRNSNTKYLMICSNFENFRPINRIFGRRKGDELLAETAEIFMKCTSDGIYGRIGGDSFALLLPIDKYNEKMFIDFSNDIEQLIEMHHFTAHMVMGVYEIKDSTLPISIICDKALLAARQDDRSYTKRIVYHNDEMERRAAGEQVYAARLYDAILNGEIRMLLQPIASVDGKVVGAEGLVRWFRPDKKVIMPEEFIDFFEETGLIIKLDQYMWREAVKELRRWRDMGREDLFVSMNITGVDLIQADIYNVLMRLTDEFGVKRSNLHLEIASLSNYTDKDRQLDIISRLRDSGFVIWMDNFGSAYSSLQVLDYLKVSAIKVDMEALINNEERERSEEIVRAVSGIVRSMGMEMVPEKVSDESILELVKGIGCSLYQGNYFDTAILPDEFNKKYV